MTAAGKNLAGLMGAAAVAAALGLYAYYGVMKPQEREEAQKERSDRLVAPSAPLEDGGAAPSPTFTRLSVTAGDETTELEKRGERWFLTSPVEAPADEYAVTQLTGQLASARVKALLEENPSAEDLARFGLAPPRFRVQATAHSSGAPQPRRYQLEGGVENPFDGSVFLRKDGQPAVYSAPGSVRTALERSTFQLRDKQVLQVDPATLASLEVKVPNGPGYVLQHEGGRWRIRQPREGAADAEAVTAMLASFGGERATAFLQEPPPVAFERPLLDATFRLTSGEPLRIRIAADKDGGHFALREQGPRRVVAQVPATTAAHLDKSYADLRDKSVLQFEREAAARMVFKPAGSGTEIELVREETDAGSDGPWRVTRPVQGAARNWKVSSLLWALSSLKGAQVAAEKPARTHGFAANAQRALVYGADGALLAELTVGGVSSADPSRVYARGQAPTVFEVDKNRLSDLPTDASGLIEPAAAPDAGVAAGELH